MSSCPIARITRILTQSRSDLEDHAAGCGDRVLGVGIHPADFDELAIVELWGLPVLAWAKVPQGTMRLLCESWIVLIPEIETYEDVLDHWTNRLQRSATGAGSAPA